MSEVVLPFLYPDSAGSDFCKNAAKGRQNAETKKRPSECFPTGASCSNRYKTYLGSPDLEHETRLRKVSAACYFFVDAVLDVFFAVALLVLVVELLLEVLPEAEVLAAVLVEVFLLEELTAVFFVLVVFFTVFFFELRPDLASAFRAAAATASVP